MILNDLFPRKMCINLDRRPDRWERVSARFEKHDITGVQRARAFDATTLEIPAEWPHAPGAFGCLMSHLAVVEAARQSGDAAVLIFEDDVEFVDEFEQLLPSYAEQIPGDWEMLFLGGANWKQPSQISPNVYRAAATAATHAYAIKQTVFDAFITLNRQASQAVDVNNVTLQGSFNCYCLMPFLTWQEEGYSDIAHEHYFPWRRYETDS